MFSSIGELNQGLHIVSFWLIVDPLTSDMRSFSFGSCLRGYLHHSTLLSMLLNLTQTCVRASFHEYECFLALENHVNCTCYCSCCR